MYSSGGEETQEPSHGRNGPLGTWKFSRWSPRSTIVQWSERKAELHPLRQKRRRGIRKYMDPKVSRELTSLRTGISYYS
ncbi:hypothetical protein AVEN_149527-1 [Araneus ventricosus]|uniref:Uncharacterized protein n=1 Tax=Araneus ventricosus TaxID=182803 RepID=A0A4Y2K5I5_ARAVE|nr:hypothetical protein AVEN_149527-1 [Araneus ventricosus]